MAELGGPQSQWAVGGVGTARASGAQTRVNLSSPDQVVSRDTCTCHSWEGGLLVSTVETGDAAKPHNTQSAPTTEHYLPLVLMLPGPREGRHCGGLRGATPTAVAKVKQRSRNHEHPLAIIEMPAETTTGWYFLS